MTTDLTRIVVVGGGFAGLESAFLVRAKLGDCADITLASDRDEFLFNRTRSTSPSAAQRNRC